MIKKELFPRNHFSSNYVMVYCLNSVPYNKSFDRLEDLINEYNLLDSSDIVYDYVYVFRATHIFEDIQMKN